MIIFKYFFQHSRLHFLRLYFANIRGQIREQVDKVVDIQIYFNFLTFTDTLRYAMTHASFSHWYFTEQSARL